jgi:hypothetical protein
LFETAEMKEAAQNPLDALRAGQSPDVQFGLYIGWCDYTDTDDIGVGEHNIFTFLPGYESFFPRNDLDHIRIPGT